MLKNVLSFLDKEGKEIILLGDTNCNFSPEAIEKESNPKNLLSIYNLFNFKQFINEPTWESMMSRTMIDHIGNKPPEEYSAAGGYKSVYE